MSGLYPWQQGDWMRLQSLRERPSQGLLFSGMKGIGKFDLAVNFARTLLCHCGGDETCECPSCHWFMQGTHPDFKVLQPESETEEAEAGKKPSRQISVDQIRALSDFMGMTAHQGGRRVVIIHPAEAMNSNAANALLKNLEEPPPGLLFILVTHKPQQLLPTLLSRCLTFTLATPDVQSAQQWLASQGIKNPADALAASGFSPLIAAQSAAQSGAEARDKLLRALRQSQNMDVFALADGLQKTEQVQVVQWLQQWCYDLLSQKLAGRPRYHVADEALLARIAGEIDSLDLARLQKVMQTAKREAQHTLNPKLFLESLFFTYIQLTRPCHS